MTASLKFSLSAIIALSLATPALAQDSRKPTSTGTSTGSSATPRGGESSSGSTTSSAPAREPQTSSRPSSQSGGGNDVPSYSRPRGSNPVRGVAGARGDNPLPSRGGNDYYYGYPYYGYNSYYRTPYAFGHFPIYTGIGYFYYDPYWGYYDPYYRGGGYYARARHDDRDDRDYNIGSLRLKVDPSHGQVYVDGLYRGTVDEFDGVFQRLKIEAGAHRVEVRAPGYRPLVFDVLVTPGETTTYRGDLKRQ